MKKKQRNNRFGAIIKDLYYRLQALPMLFFLWILLLVWKRRIEKWQIRIFENRKKLDYIWLVSNQLEGQKYEKQQRELKKFEREFLHLEEGIKMDEERYLKRKELFEKYIGKVFDPTIGE